MCDCGCNCGRGCGCLNISVRARSRAVRIEGWVCSGLADGISWVGLTYRGDYLQIFIEMLSYY